ncbi:nitrous oxide reductase accessory protein NosL [Pseudoflavitalea rhizosphaerae]|uniref:nitrous oxide reductase accessory protein NosL n=1 Tax=Pseudoflavitalea rhizosphaerae TaxID=1884793 RepID=UPI000F8F4116|nr:nitrous oxide reductase accessory protein NosL [Pseudoflavitalea rhizosphaerae]
MKNRMSVTTKFITALAALSLIAVLFFPMWKIELSAPQYPEGLELRIYPHKLGGDIEVVNGLNHYIGMRTLHTRDFVEFVVLPWIFGILSFFGLLSIVINRRWFFLLWAGFFFLFAVVAMIDFYRWEYNYGHNLDPAAPIQVPGMSYQPPLIGFKQLLNFGAYSIPDTGGWIFIAAGLLIAFGVYHEIINMRKASQKTALIISCALMFTLSSCSGGPHPIKFNVDVCDHCKMTITDPKFGGELLTKKGKIYRFDDAKCLSGFLHAGTVKKDDVKNIYLLDYANQGQLLDASSSVLLKSQELKSPMGGDLAAFASKEAAEQFQKQFNATLTSWNEIEK